MQLTANFVLLATVLAYGSSSVLALPVGSSFAREVEAREFQDDVSYYAREVPGSMYLDARGFFDGDYEDINARAGAAVDPVSAVTTPAGAGPSETPTDVKQKPLPGADSEGPQSVKTPADAATALHPPPASHELQDGAEHGVTGVHPHHHHRLTKAQLDAMTPEQLEAHKARRRARLMAQKKKWLGMTEEQRQEHKEHRAKAKAARLAKFHAKGVKPTSESATTGPEGAVTKPLADKKTDAVPVSADGASAKPAVEGGPVKESPAPVSA